MKYLWLLLFFCACAEDETENVETLRGNLQFLKQQRDSLAKVTAREQGKIFELELNVAPELLSRDTAYQSMQKNLTKLKAEVSSLDRDIESTEEKIYKPH